MLIQLNVNIEKKLIDRLNSLKEKTKVSKKTLVEQALELLFQQYEMLNQYYDSGTVSENFIGLVEDVMKRYDAALKKLAD